MHRRDFLTKSALAVGGAFAGVQTLMGRVDAALPGFSLDLVTADPERAIDAAQSLIKGAGLGNDAVRFEEHQLVGTHTGDMAFGRGSKLIDFRRSGSAVASRLTRVARQLGLPRRMDDPVLLQFSTRSGRSAATELHVYSGDVLIQRKSLHHNHTAERIENTHGYVDLAIADGSARITAASCKHKTCMKMGAIGRGGQNLVCIPNQIRIAVAGRGPSIVDGIAS